MKALAQGRLVARLAQGAADVAQAQALRHLAFRQSKGAGGQGKGAGGPGNGAGGPGNGAGGPGNGAGGPGNGAGKNDADRFDAMARHVLVTDTVSGAVQCCFRVQGFAGAGIADSYAAQFYDLGRLEAFPGPMLELGRFCLNPACHDPDVLRLAWGAIARIVDAEGVSLLFGCSSFAGTDVAVHAPALGALAVHVAPHAWAPLRRAPETVDLAQQAGLHTPRAGQTAMPALLRTYLGMGAWVSDHAVIDRAMDTLHVLTGVEIAGIPPARARALRMIGAEKVG